MAVKVALPFCKDCGLELKDRRSIRCFLCEMERRKRCGGPMKGRCHSFETKKIIGRASRSQKWTKERKRRISEGLKGPRNYWFGKTFSLEHRLKISAGNKGKRKRKPDISKIQARRNAIKRLRDGKIQPSSNPIATKFFSTLNRVYNLKGFHAGNGKEFEVPDLGYFVDYYEPNLNLVIEWDEEHHYLFNKLSSQDLKRQSEITNKLGCRFIRIRERDLLGFSMRNYRRRQIGSAY